MENNDLYCGHLQRCQLTAQTPTTGVEKVWYPGILVSWLPAKFNFGRKFGWAEGSASHYMRVNSQLLDGLVTKLQ